MSCFDSIDARVCSSTTMASVLFDLGSLRVVLFSFCMVIGGVRGLPVFVRCIAL